MPLPNGYPTEDDGDVDDLGKWHGTCGLCGTGHNGYQPTSFGAEMACKRARGKNPDRSDADRLTRKLTGSGRHPKGGRR